VSDSLVTHGHLASGLGGLRHHCSSQAIRFRQGLQIFRTRRLFNDTRGFEFYYQFVSVIEYHAKVGLDQPFSFPDQRY